MFVTQELSILVRYPSVLRQRTRGSVDKGLWTCCVSESDPFDTGRITFQDNSLEGKGQIVDGCADSRFKTLSAIGVCVIDDSKARHTIIKHFTAISGGRERAYKSKEIRRTGLSR